MHLLVLYKDSVIKLKQYVKYVHFVGSRFVCRSWFIIIIIIIGIGLSLMKYLDWELNMK
jgi:hypothetical protein